MGRLCIEVGESEFKAPASYVEADEDKRVSTRLSIISHLCAADNPYIVNKVWRLVRSWILAASLQLP